MSRSRVRARPQAPGLALGLILLASAGWVRADARLEVTGSAEVSEDAIEARVELRNVGDAVAEALSVEGELQGDRAQARLTALPAGASRQVSLRFPSTPQRPGVHALTLLLDYTNPGPSPLAVSQRAYLLLALGGAAPPPAVRLAVPEVTMDWSTVLAVQLESTDAAAHRVRLRVKAPRWLRVDDPTTEVEVPARGKAEAPVRLFRGTAPWGSRQGVVVVAEATDGALTRTTVATGVVEIRSDPAWMPRLRQPLLLLAALLFAFALLAEWRHRRGRPTR